MLSQTESPVDIIVLECEYMKNKRTQLFQLFIVFFKAGTFTFAGGLAMLPLIKKDVVEKYQMMDEDSFMEYATLAQTLPGVIALNCASFVGLSVAGIAGMLVAGFGAVVTAFLLMIVATVLIQMIPETGPVLGALSCIRAASSALILSAAFSLGRHNLKSGFAILIMLMVFFAILFTSLSAPFAILGAGTIGYFYQRFSKKEKGSLKKDNAAVGRQEGKE